MFDDLKDLIAEFDLYGLTHPASAEQFIMNMFVLVVIAFLGYLVLKTLGRLF